MTTESRFPKLLNAFRNYVMFDLLGGPKVLEMRYIINAFKGLTALWIYSLMLYF